MRLAAHPDLSRLRDEGYGERERQRVQLVASRIFLPLTPTALPVCTVRAGRRLVRHQRERPDRPARLDLARGFPPRGAAAAEPREHAHVLASLVGVGDRLRSDRRSWSGTSTAPCRCPRRTRRIRPIILPLNTRPPAVTSEPDHIGNSTCGTLHCRLGRHRIERGVVAPRFAGLARRGRVVDALVALARPCRPGISLLTW